MLRVIIVIISNGMVGLVEEKPKMLAELGIFRVVPTFDVFLARSNLTL